MTPHQHANSESSWHLYVLCWKLEQFTVSRKEIFEALRAQNIGVHVHYIPIYMQPYYQRIGYADQQYINAEEYYRTAISLPIFPGMTDQDVEDVKAAVIRVYNLFILDDRATSSLSV
ncbi:UDP-4-amino-4-deoxy-L-arabinose--oxoglutarate aminotransferase [compost metagenome]